MGRLNTNKKGAAIFASGGDQYQPANIPLPKQPLADLEAQLARHREEMPHYTDILARTKWALKKSAIEARIALHKSTTGKWRPIK